MHSAQADAELAKSDLDRAHDLASRKVISKAELDAAESKYTQKKAMVDNMQAIIDKKEIHAPFDGVAGIRSVNPGQMVAAGDPLVSLQTLDHVFVDFSLAAKRPWKNLKRSAGSGHDRRRSWSRIQRVR